MTFRVLHKGIQMSLPIDVENITEAGILWEMPDTGDIVTLKSGLLLALNNDGTVEPATATSENVVGFAVLDAKGGSSWENVPAAASGLVAVTFGNCVIETDVITSGETINPGAFVYAGANGLLTGTKGTTAPIGIALTKSVAASPLCQIAIFGGPTTVADAGG